MYDRELISIDSGQLPRDFATPEVSELYQD